MKTSFIQFIFLFFSIWNCVFTQTERTITKNECNSLEEIKLLKGKHILNIECEGIYIQSFEAFEKSKKNFDENVTQFKDANEKSQNLILNLNDDIDRLNAIQSKISENYKSSINIYHTAFIQQDLLIRELRANYEEGRNNLERLQEDINKREKSNFNKGLTYGILGSISTIGIITSIVLLTKG